MDVVFDWNLGNKIHRGLITLRLCGFPFAEIEVVSSTLEAATTTASTTALEASAATSSGSVHGGA
jgi:hypothetical protein